MTRFFLAFIALFTLVAQGAPVQARGTRQSEAAVSLARPGADQARAEQVAINLPMSRAERITELPIAGPRAAAPLFATTHIRIDRARE